MISASFFRACLSLRNMNTRPTKRMRQSTPLPNPTIGGTLRGSKESEMIPVAASAAMNGRASIDQERMNFLLEFFARDGGRFLEELGGFDAHARRAEVHMVIVDSHLSRHVDAV